MNDLKITNDGNCPSCASAEWKLASMLLAEETAHTANDTLVYAPPPEPSQYWSKNNRLINCSTRINEAPKVKNCLWFLKEKFDEDCGILSEFRTYEKEKALWKKTRVCSRCDERFVTKEEFHSTKADFELPEWPSDLQ